MSAGTGRWQVSFLVRDQPPCASAGAVAIRANFAGMLITAALFVIDVFGGSEAVQQA
jgi:hypothetical protein